MLYALLKFPATVALWLYCRIIVINKPESLKLKGPLLIAANHPNSFLDAIILASLFKQPIYSLARGDVFKNKFFAKLLYSLNIYPVYRTSEGVENMEHNYSTFNACREIFKKNGIVLIFSEGRCINEWHLRPLKKGTARLALSSWEQDIPLTVLPTGINYSNFHHYHKNMHILFGEPMRSDSVEAHETFGKKVTTFNQRLQQELKALVYEIPLADHIKRAEIFQSPVSVYKKILLCIPALAGVIVHLPLHAFAKSIAHKYGSKNDHYDSILIAVLFVAYPWYLLLITALVFGLSGCLWSFSLILLLPFCAWSTLQLRRQSFSA